MLRVVVDRKTLAYGYCSCRHYSTESNFRTLHKRHSCSVTNLYFKSVITLIFYHSYDACVVADTLIAMIINSLFRARAQSEIGVAPLVVDGGTLLQRRHRQHGRTAHRAGHNDANGCSIRYYHIIAASYQRSPPIAKEC